MLDPSSVFVFVSVCVDFGPSLQYERLNDDGSIVVVDNFLKRLARPVSSKKTSRDWKFHRPQKKHCKDGKSRDSSMTERPSLLSLRTVRKGLTEICIGIQISVHCFWWSLGGDIAVGRTAVQYRSVHQLTFTHTEHLPHRLKIIGPPWRPWCKTDT